MAQIQAVDLKRGSELRGKVRSAGIALRRLVAECFFVLITRRRRAASSAAAWNPILAERPGDYRHASSSGAG